VRDLPSWQLFPGSPKLKATIPIQRAVIVIFTASTTQKAMSRRRRLASLTKLLTTHVNAARHHDALSLLASGNLFYRERPSLDKIADSRAVLPGHGCGCRNPTRVRLSDSANPKKQDSEIRVFFLFLNFTNK